MESAGVMLAPRGPLVLADQVVLGTIDVAAVGARVLLALQPPDGWTVREVPVDIRGLDQPKPVAGHDSGAECIRPVLAPGPQAAAPTAGAAASVSQPQPPLLVRNLYAPDAGLYAAAKVSLVILNAALPEGEQAELAAALLGLLSSARAGGAEGQGGSPPAVTLVAAMLLQHLTQPAALYQLTLNGGSPLDPSLPPLPTTTSCAGSAAAAAAAAPSSRLRLRDGQLAALLHVAAVSGTPLTCLLAPGHKPPASTPLDLPGSAAACDAVGSALASALGLRYEPAACRGVTALHKWFVPEKAAGSDVMYM